MNDVNKVRAAAGMPFPDPALGALAGGLKLLDAAMAGQPPADGQPAVTLESLIRRAGKHGRAGVLVVDQAGETSELRRYLAYAFCYKDGACEAGWNYRPSIAEALAELSAAMDRAWGPEKNSGNSAR